MNTYDEIVSKSFLKDIRSNKFVYNDYNEGKQVLKSILYHLNNCSAFSFSVAFINDGGLAKLKMALKDFSESNDKKGRIITTDYLFFSDPKSMREIMKMKNIELRLFQCDKNGFGFHTKGYIFNYGEDTAAIVGSSNMTQAALTVNQEWNVEIVGLKTANAIKNIIDEFESVWNKSEPIENVIDEYENNWERNKRTISSEDNSGSTDKPHIEPNKMQQAFIRNLNYSINHDHKKRGLLISATGTGKTFASALGVKNIDSFDVNKMLFVAHRETILKQSMEAYSLVFENKKSCALYTGNHKDVDSTDFVFASSSLLQKKSSLNKFDPEAFDVIVIDEVHRVGNNKYQNIINYFKPKFLLGMSATPDRNDGYDTYALFEHNVLHEVRLMDALNSNMLTPFNYYGIAELSVDGKEISEDTDINKLASDERINHVISQAEYYGYSGNRVKGLIFVKSVDEGKLLSDAFNKRGYRTVCLSGITSQIEREKCIERLEQNDNNSDALDYIFTVDIFNEGVDIPSVNQVIMLRPTESSIVFIQQLGRGLRLAKEKEYVTVLDFIGNYKNNYCISKALSKSKISEHEIIKTVTDILPGKSSIQFDKISKERIYNSITNANLYEKQIIKKEFQRIKNRFYSKNPTLNEFERISDISSRVFLDYQIFSSYYEILVLLGDTKDTLLENEKLLLQYISELIGDGKRHIDIVKLKQLLEQGYIDFSDDETEYKDSVISLFTGKFYNKKGSKYCNSNISLIEVENGYYHASNLFCDALKKKEFKEVLCQIIDNAFDLNEKYFNKTNGFKLYERYTRRDFCRISKMTKNVDSTLYGYPRWKSQKVLPIFVTYHKDLAANSSTNYEDQFIDENTFLWFTRTKGADEINIISENQNGNLKLLLFVEKTNKKINAKKPAKKGEGTSFYYLGECNVSSYEDYVMASGNTVCKCYLKLATSVKSDVYDYLVTPIDFK